MISEEQNNLQNKHIDLNSSIDSQTNCMHREPDENHAGMTFGNSYHEV